MKDTIAKIEKVTYPAQYTGYTCYGYVYTMVSGHQWCYCSGCIKERSPYRVGEACTGPALSHDSEIYQNYIEQNKKVS